MSFLVAWRLWLLLGVGALAGAWVSVSLRRRRDVVRFTNIDLLDVVAPRQPGWRRHVPPTLFLVGLALLVVGFAEPARTTRVADDRALIVLAIDTSLSMEATDVEPDRLTVAQEASRAFIEDLPAGIEVALITFNRAASVDVAPTEDHRPVLDGIDDMSLGSGTAIGEALFVGVGVVDALREDSGGEPVPARIVLMSDGDSTEGRPPAEGAAAAAGADVPVYTIAFGTPDGTVEIEGEGVVPVPVAPGPLSEVADATGGEAFEAGSLSGLSAVYDDIGSAVGYREEERRIGGWYIGLGLLALVAAAATSLVLFQRLP